MSLLKVMIKRSEQEVPYPLKKPIKIKKNPFNQEQSQHWLRVEKQTANSVHSKPDLYNSCNCLQTTGTAYMYIQQIQSTCMK